MDKEQVRRLRSEGQRIEATVQVGKGGITDGVVGELDSQLKRNHLVKARFQRGAAGSDREGEQALAEDLAMRLSAEIVERRGHTLLLYRRRRVRQRLSPGAKPPRGRTT